MNKRIDNFLIKVGFNKCTSEHRMYVKGSNEQNQYDRKNTTQYENYNKVFVYD